MYEGISCFSPEAENIPPLLGATNKPFPILEKRRISKSRLRFEVSLEQKTHLWSNNLPLRRAAILATDWKSTCVKQYDAMAIPYLDESNRNEMGKGKRDKRKRVLIEKVMIFEKKKTN